MSSTTHALAHPQTAAPRTLALRERVDTAWRAPLAAACLIAAAAHVPVTGEHLEEAAYIGVLFIALEAASVVLALLLLRRPSRATLLAISVVGALAVLALVISRTVGLPLIGDDVGNWTEPLAVISFAAEAVMAVGGARAAAQRSALHPVALRLGLAASALILVLGGFTTVLAASAAGADHGDESHGTTADTPGTTTEMPGMSDHMDGMRIGLGTPGSSALQ